MREEDREGMKGVRDGGSEDAKKEVTKQEREGVRTQGSDGGRKEGNEWS